MPSHLENLRKYIPDLLKKDVLDIGSGRGSFIIDVVAGGGRAVGIERCKEYIEISLQKAREKGFDIELVNGVAENLPFNSESFDFINMSEVIEHVEDPEKVIGEAYRVLRNGGEIYISVPARFGLKDPHYKLFFINFLPRVFADLVIVFLKKTKTFPDDIGRQSLSSMHYYRYGKIVAIFKVAGFDVTDLRVKKLKNSFDNIFIRKTILLIYILLRPLYPSTFHFLLLKNN